MSIGERKELIELCPIGETIYRKLLVLNSEATIQTRHSLRWAAKEIVKVAKENKDEPT